MQVPFSAYLDGRRPQLQQLVRQLARRFTCVSVLGTDCAGFRCSARRNDTSVADSRFNERGFVVRACVEGGYAEFSFNSIPEGQLEALAERIGARLADNTGSLAPFPYPPPAPGKAARGRFRAEVALLPEPARASEVLERLERIRDRGLSQADLVDLEVRYETLTVSKLFLSESRDLRQSYLWSQGYLVPLVRRQEQLRYLYRSFSGLAGLELLEEMDQGVEAALAEVLELLDAGRPEPGLYEVIFSPDVAGLIAHEAFGHGVEADMFVKGRARAVDYLGKQVASDLVTMHDGAAAARQVASYWFDDEGNPGTDTVVIEDGVLRTGINDQLSALALGQPATGNGRRESFARKAYARMTNTFFAAGAHTLEEMIASVRHGYLLEKFLSGMEDPKNWGIQGEILYGREIRDGRLTGQVVSPVIVTGYVPELLSSITMVGPEVVLSGSGMCGKGHKEYVKTSTGGPYVKATARLG